MGTTGNGSSQYHLNLTIASSLRATIPISAIPLFVCVLTLAANSLALGEVPKTVRGRSLERFPYAMPELRPTQPVDKALAELGQHSLQRAVEHLQSITTSDVNFTITLFSEEIPKSQGEENSGKVILRANQQIDPAQKAFRQFSTRSDFRDGTIFESKLVQSPDGCLRWDSHGEDLACDSSVKALREIDLNFGAVIFLRDCPFNSIWLRRSDQSTLDNMTEFLTPDNLVAVSQDKEGRIVTTWSIDKWSAYSLVTDSQQGGLPVVACYWMLQRPRPKADGPFTEHTLFFTDWEIVGETPVPVRHRDYRLVEPLSIVETNFTWNSANEPLPASRFTIEAMDLPEGTDVKIIVNGIHLRGGAIDSSGSVTSGVRRRFP